MFDHYMGNCPNYLDNTITKNAWVADHDMVGILYQANIIQDHPSFLKVHDWTNLTWENIM